MSERMNQEGSHQQASADIDVGTVVADPKPATKPAPTRGPVDELPPFRVLLHNDDVNSIDHVVDSIMELTPLDHGRAVEVTLEAQQIRCGPCAGDAPGACRAVPRSVHQQEPDGDDRTGGMKHILGRPRSRGLQPARACDSWLQTGQ